MSKNDIEYDLEDEMRNSPEIIASMANKNTAEQFYAALCNMRWKKIKYDTDDVIIIDKLSGNNVDLWSCSWRGAGSIIADLRFIYDKSCTEGYMDYYCSGNEGYVHPTVATALNKLGWTPVSWDDDFL